MSLLSLYLLAPIFLAPSEEGPAVMTPDGLAWHQLDAAQTRRFDIPRSGQLVVLVRRVKPSTGAAKVKVVIAQGDKEVWSTSLVSGRGAQLGRVVAGRATRGTSKQMITAGKISITATGKDHEGILVQLELIPDLDGPVQDAVAARSEAGAADLAAKPGVAPTGGLNLSSPALIAPGGAPDADSAITVAKAPPPKMAATKPEAPATGQPKAPPAVEPLGVKDVKPSSKKPFFLATADGGLGMRQVWGGLMQNNATLRLGADLRQELLPNITMGIELRLAFLSAEGNASIPMGGMVASATQTTVRRTTIGGWAMPLLLRLTQTGNSGLQTVFLIGPAFGGLTVTPGTHPAQSNSMTGMAAVVRLQPKAGIALGPTQLRIGAEMGWQGLWADRVSASRGFVGVDLGLPWSL